MVKVLCMKYWHWCLKTTTHCELYRDIASRSAIVFFYMKSIKSLLHIKLRIKKALWCRCNNMYFIEDKQYYIKQLKKGRKRFAKVRYVHWYSFPPFVLFDTMFTRKKRFPFLFMVLKIVYNRQIQISKGQFISLYPSTREN